MVHDRAHQGCGVEGVADAHVPVGRDEAALQFAANGFVDDDAPRAGAPLPRRADRAEEDGGEDQVDVRVRRHDDRVVAAEFEYGAAQALADHPRDPVSHSAAPRGRNQRNAPVMEEPVPNRGPSSHNQRKDCGVVPVFARNLGCDAGACDGGERGLAGRLPEGGVAADGGDRGVPAPHRDREVEGGDDADHAERVPLLEHAVVGALGVHRQAVELAREAGREVADVDHLLHFAFALGEDLAHLEGDELAEGGLVLAEAVADLADDLAALRGRDGAPIEKGLVCARDDMIVLVPGDLAHGRDAGAVDRRVDVELGAGADPLAGEAAGVEVVDAERREQAGGAGRGRGQCCGISHAWIRCGCEIEM